MSDENITVKTLHEGDTFSIYRIENEEGEIGYDLNLFDSVTLHFIEEEWNEFLDVLDQVTRKP